MGAVRNLIKYLWSFKAEAMWLDETIFIYLWNIINSPLIYIDWGRNDEKKTFVIFTVFEIFGSNRIFYFHNLNTSFLAINVLLAESVGS